MKTDGELYEEMYKLLFSAITDALEEMYRKEYAAAGSRLQLSQRKAEEIYLQG